MRRNNFHINNKAALEIELLDRTNKIKNTIRHLNEKRIRTNYASEKQQLTHDIQTLEFQLSEIENFLVHNLKSDRVINLKIDAYKKEIREIEYLLENQRMSKKDYSQLLNKKMDLNIFISEMMMKNQCGYSSHNFYRNEHIYNNDFMYHNDYSNQNIHNCHFNNRLNNSDSYYENHCLNRSYASDCHHAPRYDDSYMHPHHYAHSYNEHNYSSNYHHTPLPEQHYHFHNNFDTHYQGYHEMNRPVYQNLVREVPVHGKTMVQEVVKEVPIHVPGKTIVQEVIKEVPVEIIKEVEVIKEVPVEVVKEVPIEVLKEVQIEVPVEVPVEVIKEVPVEIIKEVQVPSETIIQEVPVEVIREVPVEIIKEVEVIKPIDTNNEVIKTEIIEETQTVDAPVEKENHEIENNYSYQEEQTYTEGYEGIPNDNQQQAYSNDQTYDNNYSYQEEQTYVDGYENQNYAEGQYNDDQAYDNNYSYQEEQTYVDGYDDQNYTGEQYQEDQIYEHQTYDNNQYVDQSYEEQMYQDNQYQDQTYNDGYDMNNQNGMEYQSLKDNPNYANNEGFEQQQYMHEEITNNVNNVNVLRDANVIRQPEKIVIKEVIVPVEVVKEVKVYVPSNELNKQDNKEVISNQELYEEYDNDGYPEHVLEGR